MSKIEEYALEDGKSTYAITRTQEELAQMKVLDLLRDLGGGKVEEDDLIFRGSKFIIPNTMDATGAIAFLERYIAANEAQTSFTKTFNYRYNDGCHALQLALKELFGTAGIGMRTMSFFGSEPPEVKEIRTGLKTTEQVPSGNLAVPMIEGVISTRAEKHREYGMLFKLDVNTKKKYRSHVMGLFAVVEQMLKEYSIYKGKAIDGQENPEFIDVNSVNENKIVFSDEAMEQLQANVWGPIEQEKLYDEHGLPGKRSVLLEGPFGTGKSSALMITAARAIPKGWTFIMCRPGKDNLQEVMQTARLYQPAVVGFEDIDTIAQSGEADDVTRLLDLFDGINAKGTKLMALMTTNNIDRIHKGMLRPGRLDAVIHIGALDKGGVERMVRSLVSEKLLSKKVDWDAVFEANSRYLPAYIKEGVDRSLRYALSNGHTTIGTEELVHSAEGLRRQWSLMEEAGEGERIPLVDEALREVVADVMQGAQVGNFKVSKDGQEYQPVEVRNTENGYKTAKV